MTREFLKMHGLGNDFVVIDARHQPYAPDEAEVRALSDRKTGVGCDQFIVVEPAQDPRAAAFMRIRNADGSEVSACGNASRCVGWLLLEETGGERIVFETAAGLLEASRAGDGLITVDMGPANLEWTAIPLAQPIDTLHLPIEQNGVSDPVAVNMGNPHCVFFVPDAEAVPLAEIGPGLEHHPLFPERTNVEFASVESVGVTSKGRIRMRVWERGTGITRACGTGACATLVAAARRGLTGRTADVVLDGGTLTITWREDGHVLMTGPVAVSFTGRLAPELV